MGTVICAEAAQSIFQPLPSMQNSVLWMLVRSLPIRTTPADTSNPSGAR